MLSCNHYKGDGLKEGIAQSMPYLLTFHMHCSPQNQLSKIEVYVLIGEANYCSKMETWEHSNGCLELTWAHGEGAKSTPTSEVEF